MNIQSKNEKPSGYFQITQNQEMVPLDVGEEDLSGKACKYFKADREALQMVNLSDGRLKYEGPDLLAISQKRFNIEEVPDDQVEFTTRDDGKSAGVKTFTPSGEYSYDIVEVDVPSNEELNPYIGRYYSPELNIYWRVSLNEDKQLRIQRRKYADSHLTPLFMDAFSDDWSPILGYPQVYTIIFERDLQGEIIGLKVSRSRVRNLRFDKQNDPD